MCRVCVTHADSLPVLCVEVLCDPDPDEAAEGAWVVWVDPELLEPDEG